MKTLFLVRHAKSSWDDPTLADKDRPLNARGERDAPKMGKRLAKREVKLDLIVSSPANRAITTAQVLADKLDFKLKNIEVDDRLYPGAVSALLELRQDHACEFVTARHISGKHIGNFHDFLLPSSGMNYL